MTLGDEPPTIGVIGLERQGFDYLNYLADLDCELAVTDIRPETAEEVATRFDAASFPNPEAMYETGIDGVLVATPTKYHEQVATAVFERGIDALFEKPLGHTTESAERIATAAAESDSRCRVFFHDAHNILRTAMEYAESGCFGEITHIDAHIVRRRGIPGRRTWYTSKRVAGGGALMDIGVMALNTVLQLLSFPAVEEVMGTTRTDFGTDDDYTYLESYGPDDGMARFDVEDAATAMLRVSDGATVSLDVRWASNNENRHEFRIYGTDAGAIVDIHDYELTFFKVGDGDAAHLVDEKIDVTRNMNIRTQLEEFRALLCDATEIEWSNVDEAMQIQRLVEAIYRSSDRRQAVRVDE